MQGLGDLSAGNVACHLVGDLVIAPTFLGQWDEEGTWQTADLDRGAEPGERRLVCGRTDGGLGADAPDPFGAGQQCRAGAGLDDADDRNR